MAFIAPVPEQKPRTLPPKGTTIGRLYMLVDIGTQKLVWSGEEKYTRQVIFSWELPKHTKVFKDDKGPEPFVISDTMTLSMAEKANMRHMIEAWVGKTMSKEEANAFDISTLLGQACMITIAHETKGEKTYANIVNVSALMEGLEVPPPFNKPVLYQISQGEDETFKALPEWIRNKILKSMEFTQPLGTDKAEDTSDIPF